MFSRRDDMTYRPHALLRYAMMLIALALSPIAPAQAADTSEDVFWKSVKRNNDPVEYQLYIDQFPKGKYVGEARRRISAAKEERKPLLTPGSVFKDCPECPEMVAIPAGSFEMGSAQTDERPVHTVRIPKAFAIGKKEVTQGQWKAVMDSNPSYFRYCGDDCPVENVSWDDAQAFIQRLNAKTGRTYRLPSEAEWEYSCRAGGSYRHCGSDNIDSVAWYNNNSGSKTHAVAGKQANAWGLYDMSGNVLEWLGDCWNDNYESAPSDGTTWTEGDCGQRVLRGGSWLSSLGGISITSRFRSYSTESFGRIGFRLATTLGQVSTTNPNFTQPALAPNLLEWASSDNGANINWNGATNYCASKGSGWRLPTSAELQVNYQSGHSTPCGQYTCKVSSNSRLTGPLFWTNERNGSYEAWYVPLYAGGRNARTAENGDHARALCVRQRAPETKGERNELGMTPAEALRKAIVGKWKADCLATNREVESEYFLQGDTIRGVTRNSEGAVLFSSTIELSSAKYLGSAGGLHRISYISTSERPGKDRNLMALVIETDFIKRRLLSSTRISDGEVLARDGVSVGTNIAMPYSFRCGN